jgi:uncharacterized protein YaaR (DUF327 family)
MARIESVDSSFPFKKSERQRRNKKKVGESRSFDSIIESYSSVEGPDLHSLPERTGDSNLEALLDEVHETGEKLKEAVTMENVRAYRNAVKEFLRYVVREMMEVEEKVSGKNVLKRKRFTIVNIIDKKLENLVAEVLRGQSEQLDILERIDEINGLIIDVLS